MIKLTEFPPELITEVAMRLDHLDLINLRCTCTKFNDVLQELGFKFRYLKTNYRKEAVFMELSHFTKDVKKDPELLELLLKDDECFGFFVSSTDISHLNLLKPTGIESIDHFLREGYDIIDTCASLPELTRNEEAVEDIRGQIEDYVQLVQKELSQFSRGSRVWIFMANTSLSKALIDFEQDIRITDIFADHRNLWISCLDYLKAKGFIICVEDVSAHLAKRILGSPMALRKHGAAFVISLLDRLDNLEPVINYNNMFVYEEYFGSSAVKSYTVLIDYCKKKRPLEQERYLSKFCYSLVKYIFSSGQYSNQNDKTYDVLRGIIKMCSNDQNFFKQTFYKKAIDDDKLANKFKSLEIFIYGV